MPIQVMHKVDLSQLKTHRRSQRLRKRTLPAYSDVREHLSLHDYAYSVGCSPEEINERWYELDLHALQLAEASYLGHGYCTFVQNGPPTVPVFSVDTISRYWQCVMNDELVDFQGDDVDTDSEALTTPAMNRFFTAKQICAAFYTAAPANKRPFYAVVARRLVRQIPSIEEAMGLPLLWKLTLNHSRRSVRVERVHLMSSAALAIRTTATELPPLLDQALQYTDTTLMGDVG